MAAESTLPHWTPVEPGRTTSYKWGRAGVWLLGALLAVVVAACAIDAAVALFRSQRLRMYGVVSEGTIIARTDGDNWYRTDVVVHVNECSCTIPMTVTKPYKYQVGSVLGVRFDPRDPSNAQPLVDRPADNNDLLDLLALVAIGGVALLLGSSVLIRTKRRRRRERAFMQRHAPMVAVRAEPWHRRSRWSARHYLVLFDAANANDALICVPVRRKNIACIQHDYVLSLYGSAERGRPAVVAFDQKVIASSVAAKAGHWEQEQRDASAARVRHSDRAFVAQQKRVRTRVVTVLAGVVVIVGLVAWSIAIVEGVIRWEHLRTRGVRAEEIVLGASTEHDDGDWTYYLYVSRAMEPCRGAVWLRVTNLARHPEGSRIPVRYDPRDCSNIEVLEDRPVNDGLVVSIVLYCISLSAIAVGVLLWRCSCRNRSNRAGATGSRTSPSSDQLRVRSL
jgi:hypothetical protein